MVIKIAVTKKTMKKREKRDALNTRKTNTVKRYTFKRKKNKYVIMN